MLKDHNAPTLVRLEPTASQSQVKHSTTPLPTTCIRSSYAAGYKRTSSLFYILNVLLHEKTCLLEFANNKGADQPAHPRRLISSFVICLLKVSSTLQSDLPQPTLWNSVESNLGCTLRVYFDNVTLTSHKPCQHNNKCDCSKTNGYKLSCFFFH